ncbi:hypothetical protein FQZ97_1138980 [compost metagenome]
MLASMVSWSSLRITATFSLPVPLRAMFSRSTVKASGSSGSSTKLAVLAYSAAAMPARLPKTLMSSSELVPRRLEP